jgi:hypothetical protein
MKIALRVALATATLLTAPAMAWDGAVTGSIYRVDVSDSPYFTLRVELRGFPTLCTNGTPWAYVHRSSETFSAFVAALLAAKAAGDSVTLYTTRDSSGYCQLGYISAFNP